MTHARAGALTEGRHLSIDRSHILGLGVHAGSTPTLVAGLLEGWVTDARAGDLSEGRYLAIDRS